MVRNRFTRITNLPWLSATYPSLSLSSARFPVENRSCHRSLNGSSVSGGQLLFLLFLSNHRIISKKCGYLLTIPLLQEIDAEKFMVILFLKLNCAQLLLFLAILSRRQFIKQETVAYGRAVMSCGTGITHDFCLYIPVWNFYIKLNKTKGGMQVVCQHILAGTNQTCVTIKL